MESEPSPLAPELSDEELHRCGRALRRCICAALLEKSITPDELRDELRMLVDGFASPVDRTEQPLGDIAVVRTAAVVAD